MQAVGQQAPIFLVSLRYRQELAAAVETAGRSVVVVRKPEDAARRFAQSASLIAIVDARGALERGLAVARQLSEAVELRRAAMIVLLSRQDVSALDEVHQSGATHFLVSPFGATELGQMLRFADRYVRRLHVSGINVAVATAQSSLAGTARWEWKRGESRATISPSLAALIGEPVGTSEIELSAAWDRLDQPERDHVQHSLRRMLKVGVGGEVEHHMMVDGRPHKIVHHVRLQRDSADEVIGLSGTVEDVDAVTLERRLGAHFDMLTGLANASYARAWVDQLLGGRTSFDPACIVVLVAISRFAQINAAYGRSVADSLLQAVGRRIRRLAGEDQRPLDRMLIARLAGAEFAVAFAGPVTLKDAVFFSQKLGDSFERPFIVGGRVIHLACRIGIAAGEPDLDGAEALFRRASAALAQAKTQEANSFQVFLAEGGDDVHARMASLETDLRRALENDELDMLYQPQVEVISNRIVGVEALVRWRHPVLGTLSAETLLHVAENAEFTTRLGEHILRKAMTEAAQWGSGLSDLRLSVNVTAADMAVSDFDKTVISCLGDSGFLPHRLTLEVTEGGLMENLERASMMLSALREYGIHVAIDDFGTGYSSLAYLKSLPLDYLKVDKKLVTDLSGSPRDRIVVRSVVDMARSLGMCVVAEGVESADQLEMLVREGCNWYQGYLCAPPLSGGELERFVTEWNARLVAA